MGQFSCLCLWLGAFRRILYIGVPYSRKKKQPTIPWTPDYCDISVYFCSNRLVASMEFHHLDLINKYYD